MRKQWALLLCGACGWAMRAGAQPADAPVPAKIPRVEIAPIAPVGKVAPVGVAPIAPTKVAPVVDKVKVTPVGEQVTVAPIAGIASGNAAGVTPLGFDVQAMRLPPLIARLRARAITPRAAFDAGEMNARDILDILQSLDAWGGFGWEKDIELRRQMVAVLVAAEPPQLEETDKLSLSVRLWLADYYGSIADPKCVEIGQGILDQFAQPIAEKQGGADDLPIVFQTIERIAWFYQDSGQLQKAALAWEKVDKHFSGQSWVVPDGLWQAGRDLMWAGDAKAAQTFFDRAIGYNDSFFRGMVLYDQATFLLSKGQAAQAETLLSDKIAALPAPADRIGPLWTLAQALFQQQKFGAAQTALEKMLAACHDQSRFAAGDRLGLEEIEGAAQAMSQLLQKWKGQSFELPLSRVLARRDADGLYHAKLYVHSLLPQDVTVAFAPNSPAQLVRLEELQKQRTGAGVVVSLYDVAYQIVSHPNELQVRVSSKQAPPDQTQELRVRAPLTTN